jgi:hypothetical protein
MMAQVPTITHIPKKLRNQSRYLFGRLLQGLHRDPSNYTLHLKRFAVHKYIFVHRSCIKDRSIKQFNLTKSRLDRWVDEDLSPEEIVYTICENVPLDDRNISKDSSLDNEDALWTAQENLSDVASYAD